MSVFVALHDIFTIFFISATGYEKNRVGPVSEFVIYVCLNITGTLSKELVFCIDKL